MYAVVICEVWSGSEENFAHVSGVFVYKDLDKALDVAASYSRFRIVDTEYSAIGLPKYTMEVPNEYFGGIDYRTVEVCDIINS